MGMPVAFSITVFCRWCMEYSIHDGKEQANSLSERSEFDLHLPVGEPRTAEHPGLSVHTVRACFY